jgi:hypothetical protein
MCALPVTTSEHSPLPHAFNRISEHSPLPHAFNRISEHSPLPNPFNRAAILHYNCVLSMPPLALLSFATEWSDVVAYPRYSEPLFILCLLACLGVGSLLNYRYKSKRPPPPPSLLFFSLFLYDAHCFERYLCRDCTSLWPMSVCVSHCHYRFVCESVNSSFTRMGHG